MAVSTSRGAGRFSLLGLALGYLALVPPGLVLFVLVAGATVLIPAWVGVPLVLAVLALLRSYTGLYRARAARILGTAVERPYRPVDRRDGSAASGGWRATRRPGGTSPGCR
jgi:Putative sensor